MERKLSRTIIAASITLAVCLALGFGAVYLYRAYKISDIVSDESTQDNISRFMTGAYRGYRELNEEGIVEKIFTPKEIKTKDSCGPDTGSATSPKISLLSLYSNRVTLCLNHIFMPSGV